MSNNEAHEQGKSLIVVTHDKTFFNIIHKYWILDKCNRLNLLPSIHIGY